MSKATFNNALLAQKREKKPKDWAITQNNFGVSLQAFGTLQDDVQMLAESIECYQGALEETPQEKNPVGWLMILSNLAAAEKTMAIKTKDSKLAEKANADFDQIIDFLHDADDPEYLKLAKEHKEKR